MSEARLYALPGSPPCVAVERALELKGIAFDRVVLLPIAHFAVQKTRFGRRTVPGLRFADGEKVAGSGAIMRRLDERVAEPSLRTGDPEVAEAERFGDGELQDAARWIGLQAMQRSERSNTYEFIGGPEMPVPRWWLEPQARLGVRMYARAVGSTKATARESLSRLPGWLDRIDGLIGRGVIGGDPPNAADLQIGSVVRFLACLGDLSPLLTGRRALALADPFAGWHAELPAGLIPREWLPA